MKCSNLLNLCCAHVLCKWASLRVACAHCPLKRQRHTACSHAGYASTEGSPSAFRMPRLPQYTSLTCCADGSMVTMTSMPADAVNSAITHCETNAYAHEGARQLHVCSRQSSQGCMHVWRGISGVDGSKVLQWSHILVFLSMPVAYPLWTPWLLDLMQSLHRLCKQLPWQIYSDHEQQVDTRHDADLLPCAIPCCPGQ